MADRIGDLKIDPAAYREQTDVHPTSILPQAEATVFHLTEEGKMMQISPDYLQQGQQAAESKKKK
jgi:hypothetical protein